MTDRWWRILSCKRKEIRLKIGQPGLAEGAAGLINTRHGVFLR